MDLLIELQRVSDDPEDRRRRMVTSRRFDHLDLTAELRGHRYVLVRGQGQQGQGQQQATDQREAARAAVREAVQHGELPPATDLACARCGRPAAEYHHASYAPGDELDVEPLCRECHQQATADPGGTVRETVAVIRAAGGEMTTDAFMEAVGIKGPGASKRLNAAAAAGLLTKERQGGRRGPVVWRLADAW